MLELAKVANARRLWGDADRWCQWRTQTIRDAVNNEHLYWRVLWLGLKAHGGKYGELLPRFLGSLRAVLTAGGLAAVAEELAESADGTVRRRTAALLDESVPEWRALLAAGKNVFPLQIPEIWSALYAMNEAPVPAVFTNGATRPVLSR